MFTLAVDGFGIKYNYLENNEIVNFSGKFVSDKADKFVVNDFNQYKSYEVKYCHDGKIYVSNLLSQNKDNGKT